VSYKRLKRLYQFIGEIFAIRVEFVIVVGYICKSEPYLNLLFGREVITNMKTEEIFQIMFKKLCL